MRLFSDIINIFNGVGIGLLLFLIHPAFLILCFILPPLMIWLSRQDDE